MNASKVFTKDYTAQVQGWPCCTANIYSQFTVIGCVTFPNVMKLSDIEEYCLRSIALLGCNMHSQITVGTMTLPKLGVRGGLCNPSYWDGGV